MQTYEQLLDSDSRWALREGSRHFDEKSAVFEALRKIADRLDGLGVPYAVVGGMALFKHGYRRFTEDVDILVSKEDLKTIHERLEGLGYLPPHQNSKHLRDTEFSVRIEFLVSGGFPGDGKPKPVAFPDPQDVSFESEGIRYVKLHNLIDLKLASGMTSPGRLKDLADVLELIKALNLPFDYSQSLSPYVRDKFAELWNQSQTRYVRRWRDSWLADNTMAQRELSLSTDEAAAMYQDMLDAGVVQEESLGGQPGDSMLVSTDPEIAEKYDMIEESEFWEIDSSEGTERTE